MISTVSNQSPAACDKRLEFEVKLQLEKDELMKLEQEASDHLSKIADLESDAEALVKKCSHIRTSTNGEKSVVSKKAASVQVFMGMQTPLPDPRYC